MLPIHPLQRKHNRYMEALEVEIMKKLFIILIIVQAINVLVFGAMGYFLYSVNDNITDIDSSLYDVSKNLSDIQSEIGSLGSAIDSLDSIDLRGISSSLDGIDSTLRDIDMTLLPISLYYKYK